MRVVLLLGSSTAGKSSLCSELVKNHGWLSISIDEVCEKIGNELTAKAKIDILNEFKKNGLANKLLPYLSEDEIAKLASGGKLLISRGQHLITKSVQFSNPSLNSLEIILKNAGFNEEEIVELAENFRLATKIGDETQQKYPFPNPMPRLYDETYIKDTGASIILDVVPPPNGDVKELLSHFHQRAKQFRIENSACNLETQVVLAYCPPKKLSERILGRNINAEQSGNLMDKREGLFPFHQLANLIRGQDMESSYYIDEKISKDEIFDITSQHLNREANDEAIFLENPFDSEALENNIRVNPPAVERPRIGSKKIIDEYRHLSNHFGFFENKEEVRLSIPNREQYDATIDTSYSKPAQLANELLEQLENIRKLTSLK